MCDTFIFGAILCLRKALHWSDPVGEEAVADAASQWEEAKIDMARMGGFECARTGSGSRSSKSGENPPRRPRTRPFHCQDSPSDKSDQIFRQNDSNQLTSSVQNRIFLFNLKSIKMEMCWALTFSFHVHLETPPESASLALIPATDVHDALVGFFADVI